MAAVAGSTATALAAAVATGELTAETLARAALDRIRGGDDELNAFIRVDEAGALAAAQAVDRRRARGDRLGPLAGVPVAVKDNIATAGLATTSGSRILGDFVPPRDATVVERLRRAGAIIVGKTNLDEFGMGSTGEHSPFGPTRNPRAPGRVPGGSSSGSAAAVAAGFVALALGTDTGGSVRQPAAYCGLVGLKPTYGRVSRSGLTAFASSLDQCGPLAHTVSDCALLFETIAGPDPADSTCLAAPVEPWAPPPRPGRELAGLTVGVLAGDHDRSEADAAVRASVAALERAGARVVAARLKTALYAVAAYHVIAGAEAAANLARFDGVRYGWTPGPDGADARGGSLHEHYERTRGEGFGPEVRRRVLLGTFALSAGYRAQYYDRAARVRTLVCRDFQRLFARCDLLVGPTAPGAAPPLGAMLDDPLEMYGLDLHTVPASLAGLPVLSVPFGRLTAGTGAGTGAGLPLGVQLVGPALSESRLFSAGAVLEREAT